MKRRQFAQAISGITALGVSGCLSRSGGGGGDFPSEEITFIVPYPTGSGFDAYARAISDVWDDEVGVDVIVDNIDGAGGLTATETLYSADPDGYTVGFLNIPGFSVSELTQDVNYELAEMEHLARVTQGTYVLYGNPDEVESWDDLTEMETVDWGVEGMGASNAMAAIVTSEAAGMDTNFVTGYSSPEIRQAVIQTEIDVGLHTVGTARDQIEEGDLQPLLVFSEEPIDWMPDAQLTEDVPELEGLAQVVNMSRIVSAPPDLDEDRAAFLEETLLNTLHSDELEEWAEETGQALNRRAGRQEAGEVIDQSLEIFEQYVDVIEEYVED